MKQGFRRAAKGALLIVAAAAVALPSGAGAQVIENFRIRPGIGAKLQPDFIGGDSLDVAPLVKFSVKRGEGPFDFSAPDDNFGFSVIGSDRFSIGPALKIQDSRKESEVGAEVGKVSTTVEAGGFASYQLTDSVRLRTEVRKGLGGHEGWIGSLSADQVWRDGDRYLVSIGPRLSFSGKKYSRAYFGVDDEAALATGLERYRPGGGFHGAGAAASAHYQIGDSPWGLYGFAQYERLLGDAADSPIIREYGSKDQFSVGLAITRVFNLRL